MTRINCVPVEELTGKHLVAEYRELPRVYNLAVAAYARGEDPYGYPATYRLGAGHVRFFYSRLGYVAQRHRQLIAEMKRRGYKPTYHTVLLPDLPSVWCRKWKPTEEAKACNRARLKERGA